LDVGGPSTLNTKSKKSHKTLKTKPKSDILTKDPKQTQRSCPSVASTDSFSSSDLELASVWTDNEIPQQPIQSSQSEPVTTHPVPSPTFLGSDSLTVVAEVHCSQGGTKAMRLGVPKTMLSLGTPSTPPNSDEIVEDNEFTVVTPRNKRLQSKTPPVSETAIITALPTSPTPDPQAAGDLPLNKNQFLNTPRQKIPPVVIHHHFQGDMTQLNKDFHSQYQPIGFTTYRIKAGIACQTSTYQNYLDLQTFLKQHKVPFNLLKHNESKPHRVVLKGIPPSTPPKVIQDELIALGFSVQNVIPMSAWRDKTPLPMFIIDLDNVPQSHKILQLTHLCYIRITVEPYKGRIVPPQCARCQQFYHVAANCQAPPACAHCSEEHCSWQCEKRYEPNFEPICALCKMGAHGSRYKGCPYFRNLMDKEMRNKPQTAMSNNKQLNRQLPNMGRMRTQFQSPIKTTLLYPPLSSGNAWARPLNLSNTQSSQQPHDLPTKFMFVPQPQRNYRPDSSTVPKVSCTCSVNSYMPVYNSLQPTAGNPGNGDPAPPTPARNLPPSLVSPLPPQTGNESQLHSIQRQQTKTKPHTNKITSNLSAQNSLQPTSPNFHQPSRHTLGNSQTEQQTKELINCVRAFNPNMSFQFLLQSISAMLLQIRQHPYESAFPIIFNNFIASLLGLPYNG
jgi:hypothetical protein